MQSPDLSVPVALDRERRIAYTNLARYRMATIERPFALADLADRRRSYGALVAWLWACLVPEDARDFAEPGMVATYVGADRVGDLAKALGEAVEKAGESEKNGDGSTPKRGRSSSSASAPRTSGT